MAAKRIGAFLGRAVLGATLALSASAAAQAQGKGESLCPGRRIPVAKFKTEKGATLPAAIPRPLTGKTGDADRGMEIMVDPRKGRCIACHRVARILALANDGDANAVAKYGNHGEVGTPLNGIGGRFTEAELRLIVVDPRQAFPDTRRSMPSYHRIKDLNDVHPDCKRRPILSAQEVEDVVAFLKTLK
jgi:sulfur-oxidizing protein SoxX